VGGPESDAEKNADYFKKLWLVHKYFLDLQSKFRKTLAENTG